MSAGIGRFAVGGDLGYHCPQPANQPSMPAPDLPFFKMNGAGNSILVVDARASGAPITPTVARSLARRDGLAFDQLMAVEAPRSARTAAFVRILNSDGTEAGACGNGMRCVAWALLRDTATDHVTVETVAGDLACERLAPTRFAVDMGLPRLGWEEIPLARPVEDTRHVTLPPAPGVPDGLPPFSAVSMGNPHAVFFVSDASAVALEVVGPAIEHHALFPERVNVSFATVHDRARLRLRVWERSAGATLACGSAACASVVAAVRAGLTDRRVEVGLPGGDLVIAWRAEDDHVVMSGDTELEHSGTLPATLWTVAA
jgi:diaminopimelate epimerase